MNGNSVSIPSHLIVCSVTIHTEPKPSSPELSPVTCCLLLTHAHHTPGHRYVSLPKSFPDLRASPSDKEPNSSWPQAAQAPYNEAPLPRTRFAVPSPNQCLFMHLEVTFIHIYEATIVCNELIPTL